MNEKWKVQNKKGYLKIHIAVDIKTKEILALDVTDEKVHDGKVLKKLVNHVLDNYDEQKKVRKIKSVLTDGAYDSNTNFQYLEDKKIQTGYKGKKEFCCFTKEQQIKEQRSNTAIKRGPSEMDEEKEIRS